MPGKNFFNANLSQFFPSKKIFPSGAKKICDKFNVNYFKEKKCGKFNIIFFSQFFAKILGGVEKPKKAANDSGVSHHNEGILR